MTGKNFVIENDDFAIYYSRNNHDAAVRVLDVLTKSMPKVFEFLKRRLPRKGEIFLFDSEHELKKYLDEQEICSLEEQPFFLPSIRAGGDSYLVSPNDNMFDGMEDELFERSVFCEGITIVLELIYGELPDWLSEGLATYLNNNFDKEFKSMVDDCLTNDYIPELSELNSDFVSEFFDGFSLAAILVSYLIETRGRDKFLNILSNEEIRDRVSSKDLKDAVAFYKRKFGL